MFISNVVASFIRPTTIESSAISSVRSYNVKFRPEIKLTPGQVPEIKNCPRKPRTDGHAGITIIDREPP